MEKTCEKVVFGEDFKSYCVRMVPLFEKIMAQIIIKMFFGADNADLSIDGMTVNRCITEVLAESREQSSDWAVLMLKEKAYQWGVKPKYRELYKKIMKMRGELKNLL